MLNVIARPEIMMSRGVTAPVLRTDVPLGFNVSNVLEPGSALASLA